jgi:hypothetical protein
MRRWTIPALALLAIVLQSPQVFAQGAIGGSIGKPNKSISGEEPETRGPGEARRDGAASRGRPAQGARDADTRAGRITVVSATYGGNCGAPEGNMTRRLGQACNGKARCDYVIDYTVIGDPRPMCGKTYVAEWRCGGVARSATVPAEAGYRKSISLSCD